MSEAKHTPGPWTAEKIAKEDYVVSKSGCVIAKIGGIILPYRASQGANARLIASSPAMKGRLSMTADLIEELLNDGAFKRLEGGSDRERQAFSLLWVIVGAHRAAIARAEGR